MISIYHQLLQTVAHIWRIYPENLCKLCALYCVLLSFNIQFSPNLWCTVHIQYIPWIMYIVCTLLCFVVFQYPFFHQILGALYIYSTSQEWCTLCALCCVLLGFNIQFAPNPWCTVHIQYIPRIMYTVQFVFVRFRYRYQSLSIFHISLVHSRHTIHPKNHAYIIQYIPRIMFIVLVLIYNPYSSG